MFTIEQARQNGTDLIDHFATYASHIMLDTGEYWYLEDFQVEVVRPILYGVKEVWTIIPEGNAKTTLMAGLALYFCDYSPNPWIPVGASSRDQAEILAQQAYQMIRSSPGMLSRFRIYEGYRRIMPIREGHPGPGVRGIKVYAADVATGDGVIPYPLAICDEGHRHPDMRLYRLWKGKLAKRRGQIAMISTAGEPGTEFEEMRDRIREMAKKRTLKKAHLRSEGSLLVMNEWQVQNPEDVTNMKKVKEANPLSSITAQQLQEDYNSPTVDLGDWKRLKCNIPARTQAAAISEVEWQQAYVNVDTPETSHIDVGVDVAWKHDTFAIVPMWNNVEDGYRLLDKPEILIPPRDGSTLHPDEVKLAFERIMETWVVDAAVMDMERAEDIAAWLEDECGITVVDREQGNAAAAEDYEAFMEGLRNGTLKHNGSYILRAHVMNAISRALPSNKRRFDRPSQSRARRKQDLRVIDGLTAAAMVNRYVNEFAGETEPLVAWS